MQEEVRSFEGSKKKMTERHKQLIQTDYLKAHYMMQKLQRFAIFGNILNLDLLIMKLALFWKTLNVDESKRRWKHQHMNLLYLVSIFLTFLLWYFNIFKYIYYSSYSLNIFYRTFLTLLICQLCICCKSKTLYCTVFNLFFPTIRLLSYAYVAD